MKHAELTIEMSKEINKLYSEGASALSLAKKFDITVYAVNNAIWEPRKMNPRIPREKITPEIIEKINSVYNKGYTMKETSKIVNVDIKDVSSHVINKRVQGRKSIVKE